MAFKTISEALDWMNNQKATSHREGLDKIKCALEFLGNPHRNLKVIHIAGTNGKGSTTAFLQSLFLEHGISVGTFTSPHIMKFNERIKFNGEMIPDSDLLSVLNQMVEVNEHMERTSFGRLIFFELYTVMMFIYFNSVQPDICLIEVGLGGLFDCTNVVNARDVIITTIGFDHIEKLGNNLESIAEQKAGIIHEGVDVFIGKLAKEAERVIEQKCHEEHARLTKLQEAAVIKIQNQTITEGVTFSFNEVSYRIYLLGEHQVSNASLALLCFKNWMTKYNFKVDDDKVKNALALTRWLARMEKISEKPLIYIDGAHNVEGLKALNETLNKYFDGKRIKLIYSGLKKKNQKAHLQLLGKMLISELYFTTFNHPQAMGEVEFERLGQELGMTIQYKKNWKNLLMGSDEELIIVTGSLYFVSDVRQWLLQ